MNEKIKELFHQAYGYPIDVVGEQAEKFAELIVAECAGLVDKVIMEDGNSRGDFIRKHFGVAE